MSSKPTPKQYKIIGSLSEIQDFLLYRGFGWWVLDPHSNYTLCLVFIPECPKSPGMGKNVNIKL